MDSNIITCNIFNYSIEVVASLSPKAVTRFTYYDQGRLRPSQHSVQCAIATKTFMCPSKVNGINCKPMK